VTPEPSANLFDPRWFYELEWLCGSHEAETPEQRLLRLALRLARADPANADEMAWLRERAAEMVAAKAG
jgi:hypothetical protein